MKKKENNGRCSKKFAQIFNRKFLKFLEIYEQGQNKGQLSIIDSSLTYQPQPYRKKNSIKTISATTAHIELCSTFFFFWIKSFSIVINRTIEFEHANYPSKSFAFGKTLIMWAVRQLIMWVISIYQEYEFNALFHCLQLNFDISN